MSAGLIPLRGPFSHISHIRIQKHRQPSHIFFPLSKPAHSFLGCTCSLPERLRHPPASKSTSRSLLFKTLLRGKTEQQKTPPSFSEDGVSKS
ncbi:hypothetical protein CXU22_02675 [Akkermansia muciniphila]|uniref:Uncharacterized protein n=1 Tax=Akkermansia muciniphila TaxID=239935 RepID=A0A2N8HFY1_9BACT|nr:hypothetical protein CXU22_02675 [Akkermansia muciniphila]